MTPRLIASARLVAMAAALGLSVTAALVVHTIRCLRSGPP